jgi:hypothetical protein
VGLFQRRNIRSDAASQCIGGGLTVNELGVSHDRQSNRSALIATRPRIPQPE